MRFPIVIAVAICSLLTCPSFATEPMGVTGNVATILEQNCLKCHGQKKKSGKFDARTLESLLAGGKRGTAVVPGNAAASRLIQLVQPGAKPHMPPGKKQLSDVQIQALTAWVSDLPSEISKPDTDQLNSDQPDADQPKVDGNTTDSSAAKSRSATSPSWAPPRGVNPTTVIDLLIQSGYAQRDLPPNRVCTDQQFVRRIYLDLIGRIPISEEAQQFRADTSSDKRSQLIRQLVDSSEFATRMADAFDAMLMGRNERKLGDRRTKGWHAYLKDVFQQNRAWNEVARDVLLSRGESGDRGHIWYLYERNNKHQDMAESISKGFFGVDIACAQCHDHPLAAEIHQAHYWGLVSFFNRSSNTKGEHGFAVGESAIGGFNDYANALEGTTDQSMLTFLQRDVIPEERPADAEKQKDNDELYITVSHEPRIPKFSRREQFVDHVLNDHPLLARAMVNRMWALLMGRGIVHPPEKMDSAHPPSHPVLLEWLARDFEAHGYDIKRLVRSIVNSQAYQLDSKVPAGNRAPEAFAYGLEKPLSAESFLNSLWVALDLDASQIESVGTQFRKLFPDILPENNLSTLKQSMLLSNRAEFQTLFDTAADKLISDKGTVETVTLAYGRLYGRSPTDDELFAIGDYLRTRQDRPQQALAQVLWAMTTSAEFRFNH